MSTDGRTDAQTHFYSPLRFTSGDNNSKRAYQLVMELIPEKQGRSSTTQDQSGKCLTEKTEILSRWTEYCSELHNYESCEDNVELNCSQSPEKDLQPTSERKLRLQ